MHETKSLTYDSEVSNISLRIIDDLIRQFLLIFTEVGAILAELH